MSLSKWKLWTVQNIVFKHRLTRVVHFGGSHGHQTTHLRYQCGISGHSSCAGANTSKRKGQTLFRKALRGQHRSREVNRYAVYRTEIRRKLHRVFALDDCAPYKFCRPKPTNSIFVVIRIIAITIIIIIINNTSIISITIIIAA